MKFDLIKSLLEQETKYEKCLVWSNEEIAAEVKNNAHDKDGVDLVVDWNVMYFPDKFTFDHIVYHYALKSTKKPITKLCSDLTDEDLHKTA